MLGGALALFLVAAVAGIGASTWIKSPQQLMAESGPPSPSVLSAPVEHRILTQTVTLRGKVEAAHVFSVTPTGRESNRPVVTDVRTSTGDEVVAGKVIVEVAGRPLFALLGVKPAFRDLRPGFTGPDVVQLQAALKGLGFDPGESNGTFGSGTKRALTKFYESIGYPTIPAGADDDARLAAAQRQVLDSQRTLEDAKTALAKAPPEQKADAQRAVDRANEDVKRDKAAQATLVAQTGPTLPLSEYIFLPELPSRIAEMHARIGAEVTAPLLVVSSGALEAHGVLPPAQKDLVKIGMPVEILAETLGTKVTGKIGFIGDLATDKSDSGATTIGYPFSVASDQPIAKQLSGQDVRLTIAASSTAGEVLVVPVAALFSGSDGSVSVVRLGPNGTEERLPVRVGISADGYAEVSPDNGALQEGDRVVVGVGAR